MLVKYTLGNIKGLTSVDHLLYYTVDTEVEEDNQNLKKVLGNLAKLRHIIRFKFKETFSAETTSRRKKTIHILNNHKIDLLIASIQEAEKQRGRPLTAREARDLAEMVETDHGMLCCQILRKSEEHLDRLHLMFSEKDKVYEIAKMYKENYGKQVPREGEFAVLLHKESGSPGQICFVQEHKQVGNGALHTTVETKDHLVSFFSTSGENYTTESGYWEDLRDLVIIPLNTFSHLYDKEFGSPRVRILEREVV